MIFTTETDRCPVISCRTSRFFQISLRRPIIIIVYTLFFSDTRWTTRHTISSGENIVSSITYLHIVPPLQLASCCEQPLLHCPPEIQPLHIAWISMEVNLHPNYSVYFDIRQMLNLCKYVIDETILSPYEIF